MKKQLLKTAFMAVSALLLSPVANAQTANMQDRALWGSIAAAPGSGAINIGNDYTSANNKMLLTWRMLPGDDENTAFNLWRKMGENGTWSCVNDAFKTGKKGIKATNYQHTPLSTVTGDLYYRLTYADETKSGADMNCDEYIGEYVMKAAQAKAKVPYVSIPLQSTADCSDYPDIFTYEANDCSVSDLDGDGKLEIVVKRLLSGGTADDSGSDPRARHTIVWDAYKVDGTFLWRVKSGPNIIVGNSSSVMLGDLDGDGCAEFVLKTGEGTVFGDGKEIGDTDNDGMTDYRKNWGGHYTGDKSGKYGGPEYFSVVDGKTGRELARGNFIARGPEEQTPAQWMANAGTNSNSWGDNYWKRANSLRMGLAQFTGKGMQVFLGRGVYARTVVEGWDYTPNTPDSQWQLEGTLTRLWKFDSAVSGGHWSNVNGEWTKDGAKNKDGKANSAYAGQGNHAFNVADLDGDGLDEVMYGSCAFDNDGTGLWTTGLGHGDANHVGVFQKGYTDGLQVFHCLEGGKTEVALHNAKTGAIIWDIVAPTEGDQGRCMVADVDPNSPGCEFWKYGNELFDQNGQPLYNNEGKRKEESSCNAGIWFDGTLSRQMINENIINSYSNGRTFTIYRYEGEVSFNNSTKSNPGWYGDMLGDWREEFIVPDATKLDHINIFSTWYPTEHRIPWLMTDHTYYMQAIHENVGYNQPTNVGYYLGSDQTDAEIWVAAKKAEDDRLEALEKTLSGISATLKNEAKMINDNAIYSLSGQKVSHPGKGLYIIGGRKVVIK
jgi:rhamnogalacturonan endolyase